MSLCSAVLHQRHALLLSGGLLLSVLLAVGQAQVPTTITPDGTLGTKVTQRGNVYDITGGTQPGNGPNLLHSFDRFSVGTNDTARFSGPTGIANILSRVTGGQQSVIDGRLQSTIPGANLYLLNPSGVLFGPNASLDVSGSLHVSTADYLRFADGATFSARLGAQSTLTVAPPAAFGFLHQSPAGIAVQGSVLRVPPGQGLSLVGGNIDMLSGPNPAAPQPNITAPRGRITMVSVASTGEVPLPTAGQTPALDMGAFAHLGTITLERGARLNTNGDGGGGGGTVVIRGGRLWVNGGRITADTGNAPGAAPGTIDIQVTEDAVFTNGAGLTTDVVRGAGNAGAIQVTARRVEARQNVRIESSTGEESSGNAGQITITADTLTVEDGARLWANTEGTGTGGTVRVTAQDRVRLSRQGGEVTGLFSRTQGKSPGSGAAGRVELVAPIVELTEGARIGAETLGAGAAGVIEIRAERLLTVDGSDSGISARTLPGSSGKGGVLDISAGELTVTKGGQLASGAVGGSAGDAGRMLITADTLAIAEGGRLRSVTEGSGNGSNIILRARQMTVTEMETRVEADAEETSTGNAGHILIEADTLTVATGGRIGTVTNGPGNGGNIELRVGRLLVTDGGRITAGQDALGVRHGHTPSGSGGRIQITATDLLLTQRSQIRSSTAGIGKAGEIVLEAERLMVTSGSRIDSRTSSTGQGGEIVLQARAIALRDGATIAVESTRTGRAGGIVITATDTFLSDNSTVTAAALQADGGNITLQAGSLVQLGDSRLTTTVQGGEGRGGNITIDPQFVILERSQIRADASGGPGGNVRVHAGVFLADPGSQVTASSARNVSGVIDIQAPITNLSNLVTPLPPDFAPAAALLRDPCTARLREGMVSSLVARGRASLPTTYDGILPSRLYEPQQHQTPAAGAAHTPGYMRAAAPGQRRAVPARRFQGANASALSPLRLHLLCGRP